MIDFRFDLRARRVLVLGSSGAIGSAIIDGLTSQGAAVIGADLRPRGDFLQCDVTDVESVRTTFDAAEADGALTDVVHAVGKLVFGPIQEVDLSEAEDLLRTNLLSCLLVAKLLAERLASLQTVTFLASHAAAHGAANWSVYSASKAGVVSIVQSLAKEFGPYGVRVNAVSPGSVDSPMMTSIIRTEAQRRGVSEASLRSSYGQMSPLGRMATVEDVANACVYLLSPMAAFVSGSELVMNGGERPG